jgi:hypothetical protein
VWNGLPLLTSSLASRPFLRYTHTWHARFGSNTWKEGLAKPALDYECSNLIMTRVVDLNWADLVYRGSTINHEKMERFTPMICMGNIQVQVLPDSVRVC